MEHVEVTTPPAIEPVTLDEAKLHLRLSIADDDAIVSSLITAARMAVETRLRQTLVTTSYAWFLDAFPASANGYFNRLVRQMGPSPQWLPNGAAILFVPRPPLLSVASVKFYDPTGVLTTVDPSTYYVSTGQGSRVQPFVGRVWPVVRPQIEGVQVAYTAGYGPTAANVPEPAKVAIKLLLAHWYEHREAVGDAPVYAIPEAVDALLATMDHGSYA